VAYGRGLPTMVLSPCVAIVVITRLPATSYAFCASFLSLLKSATAAMPKGTATANGLVVLEIPFHRSLDGGLWLMLRSMFTSQAACEKLWIKEKHPTRSKMLFMKRDDRFMM